MHVAMEDPLTLYVDLTDETRGHKLVRQALKALKNDEDRDADELTHLQCVEIEVPHQLELCSKCSGKGRHSLRFGAFSGESLRDAQDDEEFWDAYTSGQLDDPCDRCKGSGRLKVPAENLEPWLATLIKGHDEEAAYDRAERHAEMRAQYGTEWGPEWGDE